MSRCSRDLRGGRADARLSAMARMLRCRKTMRLALGLSAVLLAVVVACGGVNMSDDQRLPARASAGADDDGDDADREDASQPKEAAEQTSPPPAAAPSDAGASSDTGTTAPIPPGSFAAGTELETTADLNLREGPGTEFNVILTIPNATRVKVQTTSGADGWVNVDHQGTVGYASKTYLVEP